MSKLLNTIGWAIIGTPDGMQTKNGGCISTFDIGALVDINNLVIKPFPNSEIFCLFRENRGTGIVNYYIHYSFAKEIKTDRPGTFYGSVLVVQNGNVQGETVLQTLNEISNYLANYLTPDQRFTRNIQSIELPTPKSLEAVSNSFQPFTKKPIVGNREGIVDMANSQIRNPSDFFNFAMNPKLAESFSRIYASANKEVINYVKERGKIISINPENVELKLEVEQLKTENETLRTAGQSLQREKEANEINFNSKINSLNNNIEINQKEISDLKERINQYADSGKLQGILRDREREVNYLKGQLENLKGQITHYKQEYENEKTRRINQDRNVEQLSKQFYKTQSQSRTQNQENPFRTTKDSQDNYSRGTGFNGFAERIMNDSRVLIVGVAMVVVLIVLFFFLFGFNFFNFSDNRNDNDNYYEQPRQEQISIQKVTPPVQEKPNEQEIASAKSEADKFFIEAKNANNVYDHQALTKLLASLGALGLANDTSCSNLNKLVNNYGLTNYSFENLEKKEYVIQKGDSSVKAIEHSIYAIDKAAFKMKGFEQTLRAFNQIKTGYRIKAGNKLIYYVPKKDEQ